MFTNISWQNYLMTVAITVIVYYVIIGLRYYSVELKDLLYGKGKLRFRSQMAELDDDELITTPSSHDKQDYSFERTGDDEFAEVEALIARLKETIQHASTKKHAIQEFKHFLRLIHPTCPF